MSACHTCQETRAVATCKTCGATVCPAHRWSTGEPQDGYYCVDSYCAPKQKSLFSIPPWANEIVDPSFPAFPEAPKTPVPPAPEAPKQEPSPARVPLTLDDPLVCGSLLGLLVILGFLLYEFASTP